VLKIDNTEVRKSQVARLADIRAARDQAKCEALLAQITKTATRGQTSEGARRGDNNVLHLAVEAARARCTVGEISSAIEEAFGRYVPDSRMVCPQQHNR
jgi:methylmalonyl-CoA mutase